MIWYSRAGVAEIFYILAALQIMESLNLFQNDSSPFSFSVLHNICY